MSGNGQLPHRVIRDYLGDLVVFKKAFTHEDFANRFVDIYRADVPPGDDVPAFKEVHRRDEIKVAKAKIDANYKKFWRAVDGTTYFPLVFVEPVIDTLRTYDDYYALELERLLLRNRGWLAIPVPAGKNNHAEVYSRMLREFAEAHTEVAKDLADDGVLNNQATGKEALDAIEAMMSVYLASQTNTADVLVDLTERQKKGRDNENAG